MYSYLVHFDNPYNLEHVPRLFILPEKGEFKEIDIQDLKNISTILVGYQISELFSFFSQKGSISFNEVIHICDAYRLFYGKPFRGNKGQEPWNIWNILRVEFGDIPEVKNLWDFIYTDALPCDSKKIFSIMKKTALLIKEFWCRLEKKLKEVGEWERFISVEKKVNEILLGHHFCGIKMSQSDLLKKLDVLDKKIGDADRRLRRKWGLRNLNNRDEILKALSDNGFVGLQSYQKESLFDNIIDIYSENHELPHLLKTYRYCKRDKNILLKLGAIGEDRIYPIYKSFATVSGRIIVEYPSMQYLRKENRDIIIPDIGKKFLYPDYTQFEPGIMADDSMDENLINDFNSGDLYSALSKQLFGGEISRDSAKILFLAFCFGMSLSRMVTIASESIKQSKKSVEKIINNFFGRYSRLAKWRKTLEAELLSEGRIGTRFGNYRYRTSQGNKLSSEEKRWVVSQRIQGTAAYIFKKTIIEIDASFSNVDILLPMHDALLLQVPVDFPQEQVYSIEQIFIEKFAKECPSIKPRVKFDKFV